MGGRTGSATGNGGSVGTGIGARTGDTDRTDGGGGDAGADTNADGGGTGGGADVATAGTSSISSDVNGGAGERRGCNGRGGKTEVGSSFASTAPIGRAVA